MPHFSCTVQEPGGEGREASLVRQNLELVGQLQSMTAAYEALQEQLASSATNEARELGSAFDAVRPVSWQGGVALPECRSID